MPPVRHPARTTRALLRSFLTIGLLTILGPILAVAATPRFDSPVWSPDGRRIALADEARNVIYVYDTLTRTALEVARSPSSGYACNWSADGTRLGFKLLLPADKSGFLAQMPVVFDVTRRETVPLHTAVARAGVPSFSTDGRIAFTIDQELRITDATGVLLAAFPLGHYVNLAPISPDGTRVAFNTSDDQIAVIDLATGVQTQLTSDDEAYFNPAWSPDSTRLLVSTLGGRLKVIEVAAGLVHDLDDGVSASWAPDSRTVVYSRVDRVDGLSLRGSQIRTIRDDGSGGSTLGGECDWLPGAARLSPDGARIAFVSLADGALYEAPLEVAKGTAAIQGNAAAYVLGPAVRISGEDLSIETGPVSPLTAASAGESFATTAGLLAQVKLTRTVPYLHQVYDTPDDFNGHWACNATSATMALAYYGKLPYWDVVCSTPYSHVSHYGQYISRVYTYNGYTYNIGSPDPNGKLAYGGYGYIVRNDWADTKGYMRDYFLNHGVSSSVDWSPTWAKLQTEINSQYPFVVLNSLTTAGHYIVAIGYFDNQRTAIFNDPYGNKNSGYMNYYGTAVYYDWPGYNNGYANLNTVHCFIYARSGFGPTITQHPQPQSVAAGGTAVFTVAATGEGTLSYQWQKNGANLANGGHYSGVTTATLTVSSADSADAGNYRCVVSNSYGSATSNEAALTLAGGAVPPFIVESRSGGLNFAKYSETGTWANATGKSTATGVTPGIDCRYGSTYRSVAGEKHAIFKADLTAAGPYQVFATWPANSNRRNPVLYRITHASGSTDVNVDQSATANVWVSLGTYTFNAGTNAGQVDMSNLNIDVSGSMYADAVKWEYLGGPVPPTINQHPAPRSVCPGSTTTFTVAATGEGPLSYWWQKNGINLSNTGHYSGVLTSTLTVSGADAADAASYRCVVSNAGGSTTSDAAALTIRAATSITQHPAAANVCEGGTANFTVAANGDGALGYQWQKNGVNLANGGHYAGVTTATLTVSNADAVDVGNYRCTVTGGCGTVVSGQAALSLKTATVISQHPTPQIVHAGGTAVFTVTSGGSGTLSYRWQKDGTDLTEGGHYSGTAAPTLTVAGADDGDAGEYRCVVAADCGSVTSNVALLTLTPRSDLDADGDVDGVDFGAFSGCFNGAGNPVVPGCTDADLNGDGSVDGVDFGLFAACFNGSGNPPVCR